MFFQMVTHSISKSVMLFLGIDVQALRLQAHLRLVYTLKLLNSHFTQNLENGNLGGGSPLAKIAALPAEPSAEKLAISP